MEDLVNVSGEPREYQEKGFIYEFPFPATKPTQVPDKIAVKLLETGQFKKAGEVKLKPEKKEDTSPFAEYKKELIDLPKIGQKKAEDIISVYPTREKMVEAAKNKSNLPWDSDIDKVLKDHFGGN